MKTYLVGGAVRDTLLGLNPKDKDYVVVGATPHDVEGMLAQGFKQVGADFPVFLHPETGEEYALARLERKVGQGYNGFEAFTSPELTVEDDLRRRDLTINAMAMDLETGEIIDPFGGQLDLQNKVLRHVSEAFAEDPLRIMRVARFAARYGFSVNPSTEELMAQLVNSGEMRHLSKERVWVELEKILNENNSLAGIKVLREVGALKSLFQDGFGQIEMSIHHGDWKGREAKFNSLNSISKFAALAYTCSFLSDSCFQEMKAPIQFQRGAKLLANIVGSFSQFDLFDVDLKLNFLQSIGAFNNQTTYFDVLDAVKLYAIDFSRDPAFPDNIAKQIEIARKVCQKVDCAAIAKNEKNGKIIAEKIRDARIQALMENVNA